MYAYMTQCKINPTSQSSSHFGLKKSSGYADIIFQRDTSNTSGDQNRANFFYKFVNFVNFGILSAFGFRGYLPRKIFQMKVFRYRAIYEQVLFFTDPQKKYLFVYPQL